MKTKWIVSLLAAAICFSGCKTHTNKPVVESNVPTSTDSRLTGTYQADNGETLLILGDGRVAHISATGERIYLGFVGTAASHDAGLYGLIGPDTSPFILTRFHVSEDFSEIQSDWSSNPANGQGADVSRWQRTYRRK